MGKEDLAGRLSALATLFLALTAVQFVFVGQQPSTSRVLPTSQLIMAVYIFLALLSLESIIVFKIVTWHDGMIIRRNRALASKMFTRSRLNAAAIAAAVSDVEEGSKGEGGESLPPAGKKMSFFERMSFSAEYCEYVAFTVDKWAAIFFIVSFIVTAVLIFVLQSGYINVFKAAEVALTGSFKQDYTYKQL
jgi:hypothetical protein